MPVLPQWAVENLIQENRQLRADLDRRNGRRDDCKVCGGKVAFSGAVFCSGKCWSKHSTHTREKDSVMWEVSESPVDTHWRNSTVMGPDGVIAIAVADTGNVNAHLIAAAPEMLAALQEIVNNKGYEHVQTIIDKALGRKRGK